MNIKHSIVSIAGVVLSQALNFVSILLIGKFCGPTALGYFSQLMAAGLFIGSVIGLAYDVILQRALGEALFSESEYTKIDTVRFLPITVFAGHFVFLMDYSKATRTGTGVFIYDRISVSRRHLRARLPRRLFAHVTAF